MHPDLSPHLHTDECNKLIQDLFNCRKEHYLLKFLGECNPFYNQMLRCLKQERLARRDANAKKAKETQAARRERMKNDKTDYEELLKQLRKESKGD